MGVVVCGAAVPHRATQLRFNHLSVSIHLFYDYPRCDPSSVPCGITRSGGPLSPSARAAAPLTVIQPHSPSLTLLSLSSSLLCVCAAFGMGVGTRGGNHHQSCYPVYDVHSPHLPVKPSPLRAVLPPLTPARHRVRCHSPSSPSRWCCCVSSLLSLITDGSFSIISHSISIIVISVNSVQ